MNRNDWDELLAANRALIKAIAKNKPMTRNNARIIAKYLREAGWSEVTALRQELAASKARVEHQSQLHQIEQDELLPLLDEAISHLSGTDRTCIVMNYLLQKPNDQVAVALGISQEAARSRRRYLDGVQIRLQNALNPFMVPATAGLSAASWMTTGPWAMA